MIEKGVNILRTQESERNFVSRCLHHHIFDTHLTVSLVDYMDLQIRAVEPSQFSIGVSTPFRLIICDALVRSEG